MSRPSKAQSPAETVEDTGVGPSLGAIDEQIQRLHDVMRDRKRRKACDLLGFQNTGELIEVYGPFCDEMLDETIQRAWRRRAINRLSPKHDVGILGSLFRLHDESVDRANTAGVEQERIATEPVMPALAPAPAPLSTGEQAAKDDQQGGDGPQPPVWARATTQPVSAFFEQPAMNLIVVEAAATPPVAQPAVAEPATKPAIRRRRRRTKPSERRLTGAEIAAMKAVGEHHGNKSAAVRLSGQESEDRMGTVPERDGKSGQAIKKEIQGFDHGAPA